MSDKGSFMRWKKQEESKSIAGKGKRKIIQ
jgi:hypothetical protein